MPAAAHLYNNIIFHIRRWFADIGVSSRLHPGFRFIKEFQKFLPVVPKSTRHIDVVPHFPAAHVKKRCFVGNHGTARVRSQAHGLVIT